MRWPDGPICPHCGVIGNHYQLEGKAHRKGLYKCCEPKCRKQFSVTVGTVFERSHVPLSKWLAAAYFLCSSKKGMSAHQLHCALGVTYKTAWFLAHRIRFAMGDFGKTGPMGEGGGIVEADEDVSPEGRLATDEARMYRKIAEEFAEQIPSITRRTNTSDDTQRSINGLADIGGNRLAYRSPAS